MKTKILVLLCLIYVVPVFAQDTVTVDTGILKSKDKKMSFLQKMYNKHSFKNFSNEFKLQNNKSFVAGVRGAAVETTKTFEPYWKGKLKSEKKDVQKSDTDELNVISELDNILEQEEFEKALEFINTNLKNDKLKTITQEYLYLKLIYTQTSLNKKLDALKTADEYLKKFPTGTYRKDVAEFKSYIYNN